MPYRLWSSIKQFTDSPQETISFFEEIITHSELEPTDFLVKTNQYPTDFFIIKTGLIRSYLVTEEEIHATLAFFIPEQITGALSAMIKKVPLELNYQALTKVTGYRGNFLKFKALTLKQHVLSKYYREALKDTY